MMTSTGTTLEEEEEEEAGKEGSFQGKYRSSSYCTYLYWIIICISVNSGSVDQWGNQAGGRADSRGGVPGSSTGFTCAPGKNCGPNCGGAGCAGGGCQPRCLAEKGARVGHIKPFHV